MGGQPMPTITVETWEAFEFELRGIQAELVRNGGASLLFRGQSDARFDLSTTLDRDDRQHCSFDEYYRSVLKAKPQVEAFTERVWQVPDYEAFRGWLRTNDTLMPIDYPAYELVAYLRHHGFPSPLLDWSRSPYVAAYFAFATTQSTAGRVSLYVYCERPGRLKTSSVTEPNIHVMGRFVSTHRRHFLQQCEYTICIERDQHEWRYALHEEVFRRGSSTQDLLWKFSIPASERLKVLKLLDTYNLNGFSLFGTEDSLMQTIAFRDRHQVPAPYEPFGSRVRIRLTQKEVERFRKPVDGSGGIQAFLRKMSESIDSDGVLEISQTDVGRLVNYTFDGSQGGFQSRLRLDDAPLD